MEAIAHNLPALKQQRDRAQKRGFSLIEAAIVLGVVGLVVGGIWVAAKAVIDKWKAERLASGIITIVEGTKKLFPMQLWPNDPSGNTDIASVLVSAGIPPADMVKGGSIIIPHNNQKNTIKVNLLYPPLASDRAIYVWFLEPSKSIADQTMSIVISSQKGAIYWAYCSDSPETHWWKWPSDGWPPNCPVGGSYKSVFYFKP